MIVQAASLGMQVVADRRLAKLLTAFKIEKQIRRSKGGNVKALSQKIDYPTFTYLDSDKIITTLPAIEFLLERNPLLQIDWQEPLVEVEKYDYSGIESYLSLRDYQRQAIEEAKSHRSGFISSPVATGKSEILLALAFAACKQHNVMFVAPTKITQSNLRKRAKQYGLPMEFIDYASLRKTDSLPSNNVVLIANPTMLLNDLKDHSLPESLSTIGTLLTDEAHNFSGRETWLAVFHLLPMLRRSIGVSGTLYGIKECNRAFSFQDVNITVANLITACGKVIYHQSVEDVKEWIDPPHVINYHYVWNSNPNGVLMSNNWTDIKQALNTNNERLQEIAKISRLLVYLKIPHVIPVAEKARGSMIRSLIDQGSVCWYGSNTIFGSSGEIKEDQLREDLGKETFSIIGTSHIDEGTNLPALRAAILSEGKAEMRTIQRAGRAARQGDSKSFIVNFVDDNQVVLRMQARKRQREITRYFGSHSYDVGNMKTLVNVINKISEGTNV